MNTHRRGVPVAAVAFLVLSGALSGCWHARAEPARDDGPNSAAVSPPATVDIPQVLQVTGLTLPVDAYRPSPDQLAVIERAVATLTNDCMHRYGFGDVMPTTRPAGPSSLTRRYGVTDPEVAQRYGYHVAPDEAIGSGTKPAAGRPLSPEELLALSGDPSGRPRGVHSGQETHGAFPAGGCLGEATGRIHEGELFGAGTTLADQIASTGFEQASVDARVVAVSGRWSACMKQGGYGFADPFEPAAGTDLQSAAPSAVEIRTAMADVACKKATNLVGVFYGVEVAYEQVAIQRNIQQLNQLKAEIDRVVKAAAQVLSVPALR